MKTLIVTLSIALLFSACTLDDGTQVNTSLTSVSGPGGGGDTIAIYGKNIPTYGDSITLSLNDEFMRVIAVTRDSILAIVPEMAGSGQIQARVKKNIFEVAFTYRYKTTVTTIAGSGAAGRDNGDSTNATFNEPWGLALDGTTLYICDGYNGLIRKVDVNTKVVTSITPLNGFFSAYNLAVDTISHQLFVTNFNTDLLRVEPDGSSSIIYQGEMPIAGVAVGPDRKVYFNNNTNGRIYRVDPDGLNDTLLVANGPLTPRNMFFDATGTLWVSAYGIYTVSSGGVLSLYKEYYANQGWEIARDKKGNIYSADHFSNTLSMIEKSTGKVIVIAGSGNAEDVDGEGLNAGFNGPMGITIDNKGVLYVTTYNFETAGGNKVRKIVVR
ncbi:IPT/TIG domain-containing protein [Chitinophaga sp.]|uniref:IPT/TIG domain-containing protein n=1 Tax=Chitinophaga sp. TaxID=1869181 RepID=UPI0031D1D2D4